MIRRVLLTLTTLLLILILGGAGALLWLTKQAEPGYSGEVTLAGLQAPARVRVGPHGVPTVRADTLPDLLFAQGYLVARERMWQMDLMRRVAGGRLAEVLGPEALAMDRLFRTLGLNASARRALADLEAPHREMLAAYAQGVNAYRERVTWRLPIEYRIAGFEPAPWAPEDSLLIGAFMAWTLSYNLREELTFLRVASRVGPERARELFPPDPQLPPPAVSPDLPTDLFAAGTDLADGLAALLEGPGRWGLPVPGAASNGWALTGRRSADGSALLANDPHLAPSMPGIWYELELIGPGLHVAGLSLPGIPLVMIGHNADLAWGFTTAMADTQDLFVERPTVDGQGVVRANGGVEAIETRVQRIDVRGAEAVELAVRSTSNGVILNDLLIPHPRGAGSRGDQLFLPAVDSPYLLALRQVTDLPDRSFAAVDRLNRAATLEEARTAILGFRQASQNLMLAHRDGGIAWQVSGLLPRRGKGNGAFPSPGWVAGYAWQGYLDQATNPGLADPPGEVLITANNRTVPAERAGQIGHAWMAPFRADRIAERLSDGGPFTPADLASIQMDRVDLQAELTQRALRRLEPELRALDPQAWAIAEEHLLGWDATMAGESPSAALFALIEPALYRALYGDELGPDLEALMAMAIVAYNPVQEAIRSGRSSFWDDVTTPEPEGPAEIWARVLRGAYAELQARLPEPTERRLDRLLSVTFPHGFNGLPILGRLFDVGPLGVAGGAETVAVMKASPLAPERVLFVPSARLVQVPARWSESRGTLPLGQSGHRLSPYRTDQLADWLAGRTHPLPWNGPPEDRVIGLLVLRPDGASSR
ncbi:MAG: penicillin acylase family protein [Bdellovibrio bacteriovorus]